MTKSHDTLSGELIANHPQKFIIKENNDFSELQESNKRLELIPSGQVLDVQLKLSKSGITLA